MKQVGVLVLVLAALVLLAVVLTGCESPAAQRELAQAERIRAEAQAYERERAADAAAYAERASVRQMERDAAHQRSLETLPLVLAIGGGVVICLVLAYMFYLERHRPAQPRADQQPALALATRDETGLAIAERMDGLERAVYAIIIEMQRQRASNWQPAEPQRGHGVLIASREGKSWD